MTSDRLIACLDVDAGRVVKGTGFRDLRDVGDPVALARQYELAGIDEVVFLDVSATQQGRAALLDVAERAAGEVLVPLTLGGGIRTVDDVGLALRAGADKVAINSAAIEDPQLIGRSAERFGAQCIVVSIDAKVATGRARPTVWTRSGTADSGRDVLDWARECERRGAGELLLTSIDRDGSRQGYDLELLSEVADAVGVPVIASGGAGSAEDVVEVFTRTAVSAALLAGVLHDGVLSVTDLRGALLAAGCNVREVAA